MKHHYRMIPNITEYCLAVSVPCFSQTPSPPAWGYQGHPTQTVAMTSAAELRAALPLSCAPSTTCRAPGPCLHVWRYGHKVATVASSCGPSSIGKLCSASCSLRVWTHGKWFDGKKRKGFMSQRRQRLRSASLNCSWRSSTWGSGAFLAMAMADSSYAERNTRCWAWATRSSCLAGNFRPYKRPWSCTRINRQLQRCRAQFASLSLEMPTHWCSKT